MVGGIAGAVVGCTGGVIGTYFSMTNASRPRERSVTIRFATACWLMIGAITATAVLAPRSWTVFSPPALLICPMMLMMPWANRELASARADDEAERSALMDGRSHAP